MWVGKNDPDIQEETEESNRPEPKPDPEPEPSVLEAQKITWNVKSKITLGKKENVPLKASVYPLTAFQNVTYDSSKPSVESEISQKYGKLPEDLPFQQAEGCGCFSGRNAHCCKKRQDCDHGENLQRKKSKTEGDCKIAENRTDFFIVWLKAEWQYKKSFLEFPVENLYIVEYNNFS